MKILIVRSKGAGVTRGAGEFARMRAVANLLSDGDAVEIGEAHALNIAGLRPVMARLLRLPAFRRSVVKRGVDHPLLRRFLQHVDLPDKFRPDLVLTTLAPRILPGALAATMHSAHWVHIGDVPHFWNYLYSAKILTAVKPPLQGHAQTLYLDMLPTGARKKPPRPFREGGPLIATLAIGANVKHLGYFYDQRDFTALFHGISTLSANSGVVWNITTSPRTPVENEIYIEKLIADLKIPARKITWFRRRPEKSLLEMLSQSDVAFMTEDSRTMMSDAVASGTPLFAIRPAPADSIKAGHHKFVSYLEEQGFAKRLTFDDVSALRLTKENIAAFKVINQCWSQKLKTEIRELLQRDPILS